MRGMPPNDNGSWLWSGLLCLLITLLFVLLRPGGHASAHARARRSLDLVASPAEAPAEAAPREIENEVSILVDDFVPQLAPYEATMPFYYYNRLGGDRGTLNDAALAFGAGALTVTVSAGESWGGAWFSLRHPLTESHAVDFDAALPAAIRSLYQARVTHLSVRLGPSSPGRRVRLELKAGDDVRWSEESTLSGYDEYLDYALPSGLGPINQLAIIIDNAQPGAHLVIDEVRLRATHELTDPAWAGFVWSYGMLLDNWDPTTGLVRDQARYESGARDNVSATGALAAATAMAWQLEVIERADAVAIVETIGATLLQDLPRYHGLWPHWVTRMPGGEWAIHDGPESEWASLDTVFTAVSLIAAQEALGLDTSAAVGVLRDIDWADLYALPGGIGHGYDIHGQRITHVWDTFGGEAWLVAMAYAGATGEVPTLTCPNPPTHCGSGFNDELAWLLLPPPGVDVWGNDWTDYRLRAAGRQVDYYCTVNPGPSFCPQGLFGLSAAEIPQPWTAVTYTEAYADFGVGGRVCRTGPDGTGCPARDGSDVAGGPVVVPHYAALVASLRPADARAMWGWLIDQDLLTPLTNVESLGAGEGGRQPWNHLKGSWNLGLQTLGWGRLLAESAGQQPLLWSATHANALLREGYGRLATFRLWLPLGLR
jgi:hypothetical protein